jgi:hypothetical protein
MHHVSRHDIMFLQPISVAEIHPRTFTFGNEFGSVMHSKECIMKNLDTYTYYLHRRGGREFSYTAVSLSHTQPQLQRNPSFLAPPPTSFPPTAHLACPHTSIACTFDAFLSANRRQRSLRCSGSHGLIQSITAAGAAFF